MSLRLVTAPTPPQRAESSMMPLDEFLEWAPSVLAGLKSLHPDAKISVKTVVEIDRS